MEQLKNIAPFYVGQKVVYITGINMPKNSTHIVSDIFKNPCGCWSISVNGNNNKSALPWGFDQWRCTDCYKLFSDKFIYGFLASSFRAIKQQSFPLMTYAKVIEKELVSSN